MCFFAVMLLAYFAGPLPRWDAAALHDFRGFVHTHAALDVPSHALAHLLDVPPAIAALVAIVAAGVALERRREALVAAAIVLAAGPSAQLLQHLLAHPRHQAALGSLRALPNTSYPSGHATMAMALALAAVLVAPPSRRRSLALGGAAAVLLVSLALVGDGWHYPSDVLGGILLGATFGLLGLAALGSARTTAARHAAAARRRPLQRAAGSSSGTSSRPVSSGDDQWPEVPAVEGSRRSGIGTTPPQPGRSSVRRRAASR